MSARFGFASACQHGAFGAFSAFQPAFPHFLGLG
jgi:hypothetical protein